MEFSLSTLIFIVSLDLMDFVDCTRKSTGLCSQIILIDKKKKYRMPAVYSQNICVLHSVGTFVFWRMYLFLPLEMHSFSCEWNQPQSFCYTQCMKRICIISSVSWISFHNDMLHWSAENIYYPPHFNRTINTPDVATNSINRFSADILTNDLICGKEKYNQRQPNYIFQRLMGENNVNII